VWSRTQTKIVCCTPGFHPGDGSFWGGRRPRPPALRAAPMMVFRNAGTQISRHSPLRPLRGLNISAREACGLDGDAVIPIGVFYEPLAARLAPEEPRPCCSRPVSGPSLQGRPEATGNPRRVRRLGGPGGASCCALPGRGTGPGRPRYSYRRVKRGVQYYRGHAAGWGPGRDRPGYNYRRVKRGVP